MYINGCLIHVPNNQTLYIIVRNKDDNNDKTKLILPIFLTGILLGLPFSNKNIHIVTG